jgi:integrase
MMPKAGTYPKVIQKRLGHASRQITLDTYSHAVPGFQEATVANFDRLVNPRHEIEAVEKSG